MSIIETMRKKDLHKTIETRGILSRLRHELCPGDAVKPVQRWHPPTEQGIVIAVVGDNATVLWSKPPALYSHDVIDPVTGKLRYNPMAASEDIYIPVRCEK